GTWTDEENGLLGYVVEVEVFNEDTVVTIAASQVLANDTDDDGDPLSISAASFPANSALGAAVSLDANGNIVYDPTSSAALQALEEGEFVEDSITYRATDGTAESNEVTVTFVVKGLNEAPAVTGSVAAAAVEDGPIVSADPFDQSSDVEGDTLTIQNIEATKPAGVSLSGGNGSVNTTGTPVTLNNTTNITLANLQVETSNNESENPDVANGNKGGLIAYTVTTGDFWTTSNNLDSGNGNAPYDESNLNDGDIGTGVASSGTYAIANASATPITLDFGETKTVGSVAIYLGYANRDDATYTIKDDQGNILGQFTVAGTGGSTNENVPSLWFTFNTPVNTSSLIIEYTANESPSGNTVSFREIQVFGPEFALDPSDPAYQSLGAGDSQVVSLDYEVSDGTENTAASVEWTVQGVNDAPEVSVAPTLEYYDGDGAVRIDDSISVTDADSGEMIVGATVTISSGYAVGEDTLDFVSQNGITGSFVAGVLTLTGTATVEQYEAALQSVVFKSSGATITTGNRQVDFVVDDGTDTSVVASSTVSVAGRNLVDLNVNLANDGTPQADLIIGTSDPNTINGGDGSDRIVAGLGENIIQGGNGKDIFVLTDTDVDHILDYNVGEDVIDLDTLLPGATDTTLVTAEEVIVTGGDNYTSVKVGTDEVAQLTGVSAGQELSIVYSNAEAAAQVTVAAATT
ncbi:MAG: VCBS domain-containing protein, partial [Desulfobulbia bacterium]